MKTHNLLTFIALVALSMTALSCKKDDAPAAPTVNLTEVGHENSKTAMRGDDLHLEADILAEGLVQRIDVEIHREDGSFEIEKTYTDSKYTGVKNVTFHEHVDIPSDAPLGEYHLHFMVTDREGQTAQAETHVQITEYDENEHHDE